MNRSDSAKKTKTHEIDMIHGPLFVKMLIFTLPVMASGMLQLLFNAADVIIVGKFAGDNSLAAVGSTSALINLLVNLGMGLSIGANVVVAQYIGAGERKKVKDTVHTSFILALVCSLIVMAFGISMAATFLKWMGSPDGVIQLSTVYMRIYFLGMPATFLYNFAASILRAYGDTSRPLWFLIISGVINFGLNLIFVIVFQLDVAGVALATVISQYVSAVLVMIVFVRDDGILHFDIRELHFDKKIMGRIVQIGLPAGIQGTVFSISNVVIQSAVNSFDAIVIAGNAAAQSIEGFVYMAMNACQQTAVTFVGQNYGAGEKKRILKIAGICLAMVIVIGLIFGNAAYLFGRPLLSLYSKSGDAIDPGMVRLQCICRFYFLCGIMDVSVGALRGIGLAIVPMVVSMVGACGLRLLWIATIFQKYHTTKVLYLSYDVSWIVTFIVLIGCFIVMFQKKTKNFEQ